MKAKSIAALAASDTPLLRIQQTGFACSWYAGCEHFVADLGIVKLFWDNMYFLQQQTSTTRWNNTNDSNHNMLLTISQSVRILFYCQKVFRAEIKPN